MLGVFLDDRKGTYAEKSSTEWLWSIVDFARHDSTWYPTFCVPRVSMAFRNRSHRNRSVSLSEEHLKLKQNQRSLNDVKKRCNQTKVRWSENVWTVFQISAASFTKAAETTPKCLHSLWPFQCGNSMLKFTKSRAESQQMTEVPYSREHSQ